jgi:hypothetical protein
MLTEEQKQGINRAAAQPISEIQDFIKNERGVISDNTQENIDETRNILIHDATKCFSEGIDDPAVKELLKSDITAYIGLKFKIFQL